MTPRPSKNNGMTARTPMRQWQKYPLKLPDDCILCYDFQERDNPASYNGLSPGTAVASSAGAYTAGGTGTKTLEGANGATPDGGTHWVKQLDTAGGNVISLLLDPAVQQTWIHVGEPYTLSAYLKSNVSVKLGIRWYTSAGAAVGGLIYSDAALCPDWTRFTLTGQVAPATAAKVAVGIYSAAATAIDDYVGIDCAKAEWGTSATAWSAGGTSYGVMPTVLDHSGHGYHGTVSGAYTVNAPVGLGRRFDGVDDKITVSSTINALMQGNVSMEALVYLSTTGADRSIVSQMGADPQKAFVWRINTSSAVMQFYQYPTGSDASVVYYGCSASGFTGGWHHIVLTLDTTGGAGASVVAMYIDSVAKSVTASAGTYQSASPIHSSTAEMNVGYNAKFGGYWAGDMRIVRVYNSCKSAPEVKELYNEVGWLVGLPQK